VGGGGVASMGETNCENKIWLENLKGRDDLKDLGIDGKIILE